MTASPAAPVSLRGILEFLGPAVLRVHGPTDREVDSVPPIGEARDERALVFCNRPEAEARKLIAGTRAGVILAGEAQAVATPAPGRTMLVVRDPRLAFLRIVGRYFASPRPAGIHPAALLSEGSQVHPSAYVGPFSHVGRATVGAGTVIHGGVHVADGTRIGRNVTIFGGTIIGADGFGYQRNEDGALEKFPHVGGVLIEDAVEIGANTCIDRGALGDTIIREGARIDNLVHIAHNVVVERHAAVIAHAMVGGSARIGEGAWIAPCACIRDGISIGTGATVGMGAVVVRDVPDGSTVMGAPARDAAEYRVMLQRLRSLPEEQRER